MNKYYITNGDQYLTITNDHTLLIGGPIAQAKRFKSDSAKNTLSCLVDKHPEYCIQKYFSSATNKNYVITNATKFVGNNNTIVQEANKARVFKTAADADGYIRSKSELMIQLGNPIIINENYETVNIFGKKKLCKINYVKVNVAQKTPRKTLPKDIRLQVYDRDNGICQICGKPLSVDEFTVDHIVPLQRGGMNELSNYRCLCKRCNKWKSDSLDAELINMMENIGTNYLFKNPMSDTAKKMIRAMARGSIYSGKPLYVSKMKHIKKE